MRFFVVLLILAGIGALGYKGWRSNWLAYLKSPEPSKTRPAAAPTPEVKTQPAATVNGAQDNKNSRDSASADPSPSPAASSDAKNASPAASDTDADKTSVKSGTAGQSQPEEKVLASVQDRPASLKPKEIEAPRPIQRKPSATLVRAQNYLQGRGGLQQNCEQGLMYLKAATQKNEPAAAVQMGALYASGHCVQQDRVMAYRWFNSAHELDPANPWIQTNMDQLWAEMSPQQRKQAGQ